MRTEASDLKDEDTIIVEEIVDLTHESSVTANTNVLKAGQVGIIIIVVALTSAISRDTILVKWPGG